jgi:phosphonate transport system substrate-binding protein
MQGIHPAPCGHWSGVTLHFRTWLAPSLPLALFETLAERVASCLRRPVELSCRTTESGPRPWVDDPFARGEVDVGFLCAPSWTWLAARGSVVPVPAMPVPDDPRAGGRPVYFSDVVVPHDGARDLGALRGRRWAFNDPCSLSGWFSLQANVGDPASYFQEIVQSGSHLASIRMVADGAVDGAAIDSTVLGWVLAAEPALARRIRVITSWGPHPIQPVVARADLPLDVRLAVAAALRSFRPGELARFGIARFVDAEPEALSAELLAAVAGSAAR